MEHHEIDKLLEGSFSGYPPGSVFRAQVLKDSVEALRCGRRAQVRRGLAKFGLAAAFIAGAAFLLGRHTTTPNVPRPSAEPIVAESPETVMVPRELVAWLEAAQFFQQLGMEERVVRAYAHVSILLSESGITASAAAGPAVADTDGSVSEDGSTQIRLAGRLGLDRSVESMNPIVAQLWGD